MLKRMMALGLCGLMLLGTIVGLTGCGAGGSKELIWAISMTGQQDEDKVYEVFNKKLEELLPGTQVKFVEFSADRWSQQLAAGEQMDIAWTGYALDMAAEIQKDSYLPLNDYINEKDTPNLWKEWKEDYTADYDTATVDGKLYAIPNQQPLTSVTPYLKVPADLWQYFDIAAWRKEMDASPIMTREAFEVLDDYFEKVWAANAQDTSKVGSTIDVNYLQYYIFRRGMCYLREEGDDIVYFPHETKDGTVKLQFIYDTDLYKLTSEYVAKWYEKGYIAQDVALNGSSSGARLSVLSAHSNGNFHALTDETGQYREVYDERGRLEQYYVMIEPSDSRWGYASATKIGDEQTYLSLPVTCKNPEKAIKLLDLLRAPIGTEGNDLLNLLVYGFEENSPEAKEYGTYHYTLEGDLAKGVDYTLQASKDCKYGKPHWSMGNVFLTYRTPDILEGQQEYILDYEQNVKKNFYKTPLVGFVADETPIEMDIVNVSTANTPDGNLVYTGQAGADWEAKLASTIKIMRDAGITNILNELQKQVDAYIAKK